MVDSTFSLVERCDKYSEFLGNTERRFRQIILAIFILDKIDCIEACCRAI